MKTKSKAVRLPCSHWVDAGQPCYLCGPRKIITVEAFHLGMWAFIFLLAGVSMWAFK